MVFFIYTESKKIKRKTKQNQPNNKKNHIISKQWKKSMMEKEK